MGLVDDLLGGGVQTFDNAALVAQDDSGGTGGGLPGAATHTAEALVVLPARCVTQVPVLVCRTSHVGHGIGAGGHGLGLEGLHVPTAGHFAADHRTYVGLK